VGSWLELARCHLISSDNCFFMVKSSGDKDDVVAMCKGHITHIVLIRYTYLRLLQFLIWPLDFMTRTLATMTKHTTVLTNGKLMPACACASDTNCRGFSPGALVEKMCPACQELPDSRYNAAACQGHAGKQVCTCLLRGPGEQVCTCSLRAPGERVLPARHELLASHRDLLLNRYVHLLTGSSR
jgi:hypothetical protein